MTELSEESRALLEAFSAEATPSDAHEKAVWARVEHAVAAVPAATGGAVTIGKWLLVLGGGAIAVAVALTRAGWSEEDATSTVVENVRPPAVERPIASVPPSENIPEPSPIHVDEPAPEAVPEEPPAEPEAIEPTTRSPRKRPEPAPASAVTTTSSPSADELMAEMRLMSKARAATNTGDHVQALRLLERHARTFPQGALREEAAALRVDALCRGGRVDAAATAARRFVETWPSSPSAARMRQPCGSGAGGQ